MSPKPHSSPFCNQGFQKDKIQKRLESLGYPTSVKNGAFVPIPIP